MFTHLYGDHPCVNDANKLAVFVECLYTFAVTMHVEVKGVMLQFIYD
jgi:hypothetical protein